MDTSTVLLHSVTIRPVFISAWVYLGGWKRDLREVTGVLIWTCSCVKGLCLSWLVPGHLHTGCAHLTPSPGPLLVPSDLAGRGSLRKGCLVSLIVWSCHQASAALSLPVGSVTGSSPPDAHYFLGLVPSFFCTLLSRIKSPPFFSSK